MSWEAKTDRSRTSKSLAPIPDQDLWEAFWLNCAKLEKVESRTAVAATGHGRVRTRHLETVFAKELGISTTSSGIRAFWRD